MVTFHFVRWKNLLSTGNVFTEVQLDRSKSTLIVGHNGAGKSTFIEAISFGLYNKPFRKINKPQLINSINNREALVEVEFSANGARYKVVRGIKPNVFEVYKNGALISQNASNKDYQEVLERQILRMNHRTFCQVVILGSASYVPFMQLPAWHRREIIEDLLDIQIFSVMNTLLRDQVSKNKDDLVDVKKDLEYQDKFAEVQLSLIRRMESETEDQRRRLQAEIDGLRGEKDGISLQVEEASKEASVCQSMVEEFGDPRRKLEKLEELRKGITSKLKKTQQELSFYHDAENCPTCKQGIDHDFRSNVTNAKKQEEEQLQQGISMLDSQYKELEVKADEFIKLQRAWGKANSRVMELQNEISSLDRTIAKLQDTLNSASSDKKALTAEKNKLKELRANKDKLEQKREALIKMSSVLTVASAMLKDGGIKTKIIKQYIPVMNKLINKYLASMDFFVSFELDENFEEKIKSRGRDDFSYASFSEGEKARINLAILFAWRAVAKMRNSASTNLLILDEVFDSSMDAVGTDELVKILGDLTTDTNVFVISHKGDTLYDKFHSVIQFEKHNNFSRIKR